MKVRLFTPVWGADHIDRFRRGTMASLLWHSNRVALCNHVIGWDVYSKIGDYEVVGHLCQHLLKAQLYPLDNDAADQGQNLLAAVRRTIRQCQLEGSALVTIMPDVIYGDGTFETLFRLGERPGVSLLVPHMRALPAIYDDLVHPTPNAKLVTLAIKHAHSTWIDADITKDPNNSYMGGVLVERVNKLMMVQHRLANPWLTNIIASDVEWWDAHQWGFGTFDHNWPGKLVSEGRARWIGSSDAAFMVEVTKEGEAMAPFDRKDADKEAFYRAGPHHDMSKHFISVFRGE